LSTRPLQDAIVRWDPESSGCVPAGESGPGPQKAGAGAHRLIVTAPGYTTEILPVNLDAHDTRDISVTLEPARVKVTATQIVILDRVYFDYNSDKISGTSFSLLDQVANTILANPQLGMIEVAGHTDSDGSDTYNLNLSQRRVNAVRDYLVGRGVDSARLTPHGFGETRPIDTNATDAGKARNRRVEFNIVGTAPKP
jgi:outer membrane protein OmpA-like peptidoglycan-associated protein